MRPFERRQSAAYPYFKLARWNAVSLTWQDGKQAYPSEARAISDAMPPGRFRVSRVDGPGSRADFQPFEKGEDSIDVMEDRVSATPPVN